MANNGSEEFYVSLNESTAGNESSVKGNIPWMYDLTQDDTSWIMTSSFIIFTMQTGFGLLESGVVSIKNEVNIMMKNVVDIVLGGLTYWMFGFSMSFGRSEYSNPYIAFGDYFLSPSIDDPSMGAIFAAFLFQLSFATTATTIVSGAMAERCNFKAYCIFSLINIIVYCVPAGWVWGPNGFLSTLGAVDIAGSGPVHLVGGMSAFASAWMLGPRLGRYMNGIDPLPLGSPVNAVMGLFVLWWGWLAFNSGSTYGLSGAKWHYAARAACMTMISSFGGGCLGLGYALLSSKGETVDVILMINAVLGSLVSITAGCFLYNAWESLFIGTVGGFLACFTMPLIDLIGVDDPVGATSVHGICGFWGVVAVGLFAENPRPLDTTSGRTGLFQGGGWYLLGVQTLTAVCLSAWSITVTILLLWLIDQFVSIRMDAQTELIGADLTEHKIRHGQVGLSRALSALQPVINHKELLKVTQIGYNPGHDAYLQEFYSITHLDKNPTIYKLHNLQDPTRLHDLKVLKESNMLPLIEGKVKLKESKAKEDNFGNGKLLVFRNPDGTVAQQRIRTQESNGTRVTVNGNHVNGENYSGLASRLAWLD